MYIELRRQMHSCAYQFPKISSAIIYHIYINELLLYLSVEYLLKNTNVISIDCSTKAKDELSKIGVKYGVLELDVSAHTLMIHSQ